MSVMYNGSGTPHHGAQTNPLDANQGGEVGKTAPRPQPAGKTTPAAEDTQPAHTS